MGLGVRACVIHECLKLRLVISVASQEAATRELRDLFSHQSLFVKAVTEAFLQLLWIEC